MANHDLSQTMTYLELANRLDPGGDMAYLAHIITVKNTLFQYAQWMEANGLTTHHFSKVVSEPSGTWGAINMDIPKEAGRTQPITEHIGMLEDYSYVDDRLVKKANNPQTFRRSEDNIFLSGMLKEVADAFVNANPAIYAEKPNGLRFRADYDAAADENVINAGGDNADCTSVWVVQFGGDGMYFVYPTNSPNMGIESEDLGKKLITSVNGSQQNWVTYFWFNMGIVIRQAHAVQRIASIDATAYAADADIVWQSMINCIVNLPEGNDAGNVAFMNKATYKTLLIAAADKTNVHYTPDDPFGRKFLADFMGTPIARLDAIGSTETAL